MLQPHIKVTKVNRICLISGNPDRVPIIASHLKNSKKVAEHRGLVVYDGITPNKEIPISVLTTGMGTGSTTIVLEEIFRAGGRIIIRIGSTGSLLPGDGIGTIFIPYAAVRDEGTSQKLAPIELPAVASPEIYNLLCNSAKTLQIPYKSGIVWSTDIYYSPDPKRHQKWSNFGVSCVEMESSALFIFGLTKKGMVKTGTILTSDGNLEDETNIYTGKVDENHALFENRVKYSIQCVIDAIEHML